MDALRLSRCTKNWKCVVGRGVVEHNKRCHVTVSERVPRDQVTANLLEDLLGEPALAVVGEDVGGVIAGPQLIAEDSRGYDVYTGNAFLTASSASGNANMTYTESRPRR